MKPICTVFIGATMKGIGQHQHVLFTRYYQMEMLSRMLAFDQLCHSVGKKQFIVDSSKLFNTSM